MTDLLIGGRYRVLGSLGSGGMGAVHHAEDTAGEHGEVAVKVLAEHGGGDGKTADRFEREIRLMKRLDAPGIPAVLDDGYDEDLATPFLVLPLIEGHVLSDLVGEHLPVRQVAAIGAQLADALAAAHRGGIKHRDVKPSNAILRSDGRVLLIDFGIGRADDEAGVTSKNVTVGSKRYMAPEQVFGRGFDNRTDLYGLGCVLYELLENAPQSSITEGWAYGYAHGSVPALRELDRLRSDVPEMLGALVAAMMDRSPAMRPQSAEGAATALWETVRDLAPVPLPRRFGPADPASLLPSDGVVEGTGVESTGAHSAGTPTGAAPAAAEPAPATPEDVLNVFDLREKLVEEYREFTTGGVVVDDDRIKTELTERREAGEQWPDPYVAINPYFAPGGSVSELADSGLLHPRCAEVFVRDGEPMRLYRHQRDALDLSRRGRSYVVTTGTGSGKSLSYLLPIVDAVLTEKDAGDAGSGRVRAILVYPMNALVNSQEQALREFLGEDPDARPVSFARFTGQESAEEKNRVRANPPDILLTNYVMLELLLTRREDHKLIDAARGLRFLVFDELHTYRGRQGADVAWLIRRLKQACAAPDVQCIGTSATMARGEDGHAARKRKVAEVAELLFDTAPAPDGDGIRPEDVIEETLVRATVTAAEAGAPTAEHVHGPVPVLYEDLRRHPLAVWVEDHFGLGRASDGTYERRRPITVAVAAGDLSTDTGVEPAVCAEQIRKVLLHGARAAENGTGRRLFAFKLHQFLSKGDHLYATLADELAGKREFTRDYQVELPGGNGEIFVPLSFCRDCGREYYSVWRDTGGGRVRYLARYQTDLDGAEALEPGYLHIRADEAWPADPKEALDRLPETWLEEDRHGALVVRDGRADAVPRVVGVTPQGDESPDGTPAAWLPGRFRFCLSCGVTDERSRGGEFARLATLSQEGRSTAASVLSTAILRGLRALPKVDRKLLSFVDNRQDASLQAGHFNDLVQVVLVRSALHDAMKALPKDEVFTSEDVATAVVATMGLDHADYAHENVLDEASSGRRRTATTFRRLIDLRLHADLERGWRVTMPNLEQVGLLRVEYADLDEICADERRWANTDPLLAGAEPGVRADVARVLLDEMRRELAIEASCLSPETFEELLRATERLSPKWALTASDRPRQRIYYPGKSTGHRDDAYRFVSPLGKIGRYLKRVFAPKGKMPVADRDALIRDLLDVLQKAGLLVRHDPEPYRARRGRPGRSGRYGRGAPPDEPGYRVQGSCLLWCIGRGRDGIADRLNVTRREDARSRVNTYFRDLYRDAAGALARVYAREHTAQVDAKVRAEREELFRSGDLPMLYCSPTMELGVDISALNAVLLRNVPPTPANYAQRSGRAGRQGQPALIVTYCASRSPHDQYYFKNSRIMVSGSVAPPRLDLCNQDLILAHVHAVWLREADLPGSGAIPETIDTRAVDAEDAGTDALMPMYEDTARRAREHTARETTKRKAAELLKPLEKQLAETSWWDPEWLDTHIADIAAAFDRSFDRWRGLYRSARGDKRTHNLRSTNWDLSDRERDESKRRVREAITQLELLRNSGGDRGAIGADFNVFRYLASEGFLPGYSFPRLPLAAYIPGGARGEGDYIQRSRFIAIGEFGPRALIYHEGERFEVRRVQTDTDEAGNLATSDLYRCAGCGCGHARERLADKCVVCGRSLTEPLQDLMEMKTVFTRRRDRITSDEEERHRLGFHIETSFSFVAHGPRPGRVDARVRDARGRDVATFVYGDSAKVRRINRRRRRDHGDGYWIDTERGTWANAPGKDGDSDTGTGTGEDGEKASASAKVARVMPYVEDTHNIALLRLAEPLPPDAARSLMFALERGIEAEFQLEDAELSAELPADGEDQTDFLLFVESAEGGAGVLRRLRNESRELARAARRALKICHFGAEGEDVKAEDCAKACYDCLLSYGNQLHHRVLDRHLVRDLLLRLASSTTDATNAGESRTGQHARLSAGAESGLERRLLDLLKAKGCRLPFDGQYELSPHLRCRPDFVYLDDGMNVAVFVDGPHHDAEARALRDEAAAERLEDAGWMVVRFRHDEDWDAVIGRHRFVFGSGTA